MTVLIYKPFEYDPRHDLTSVFGKHYVQLEACRERAVGLRDRTDFQTTERIVYNSLINHCDYCLDVLEEIRYGTRPLDEQGISKLYEITDAVPKICDLLTRMERVQSLAPERLKKINDRLLRSKESR